MAIRVHFSFADVASFQIRKLIFGNTHVIAMWTGRKKAMLKAMTRHAFYLLILFLAVISYMYGSIYRSGHRASNLHVLVVDRDKDMIGDSVSLAYQRLRGKTFITLDYDTSSNFDSVSSTFEAVCSRRYWGVVYIHAGSTQRLLQAIANNSTMAQENFDAMTFVYDGARYPVVAQSFIESNLQRLAAASSQALYSEHGQTLLLATNQSSQESISALFRPMNSSILDFSPMIQGTRILLNTVTMVVAPLMQFFYVMALDHISMALSIFKESNTRTLYLKRLFASKCFCLIAGLVVAADIYAFREDWNLTTSQFFAVWFCWVFYMDISYLIMDGLVGTVIPLKYAPFFIFSWIILNVTSTLFPFELNPSFYKWGYALPAHNIWSLLMQIFSKNCMPQLSVALPVLFAWWVIGNLASAFAVQAKVRASVQKN